MRMSVLLGVAAVAAVAGCTQARSENGGPTVERSYAVGDFDRIDLAGNYDVTVHTGAKPGVQARGSEKVMERLVVEVRDGVLVIEPRKTQGFNWKWTNHGKVTLNVTVPSLRGAQLGGAGDVRIDEVKGDRFDGAIAGSGDLSVERIEVGALTMGISGAGSAKLGTGKARTAEYEIVGSGGIDAKGIAAETASVSIMGAGDVQANAARTAAVNIMGSGDVDVTGGAKCTVSKAGAGDVRCS
jgi:hypothetical protein